ncbi:MAG: SDR family oxidoreductase [Chloroflexi bacterium]|nr:SDR family oxidoreductase [Chloroflexota bacterium]
MKLEGKVAIVTGSARGVGEATARLFAAEGAAVVLTDVLIDQARSVADQITRQGGKAIAIKADVSRRGEVQDLVKETVSNFKTVHVLVNNAAILRRQRILDITVEDWDNMQDVNLRGPFNCTQAVLPYMMEQKYGKIVNISSLGGIRVTNSSFAHYAASKAGVIGLTRVTALEAGWYGINVNAIAPVAIITDMSRTQRTKEELEKFIEEGKERSLIRRVGRPEDIANLALFLSSDDSSYITGQLISCDGGRSCYN